MKINTLKAAAAVGLTTLLVGSAAAQDLSVSKPVGYETLNYTAGFNYLGLRLVEAPAASGESVTANGATITVADGVADALAAGSTYLFEATSGDAAGAVTTIVSFDAAADTVTLSDDISDNFEDADTFIIRPVSTLASVFGAENDVANSGDGLTAASVFSASDQIWVPDGSGSFAKYAYVTGNPFQGTQDAWQDSTGAIVDSNTAQLVYTDGLIIVGQNSGDVVVSGSVKLEPVTVALTATFNYLGSSFPAGLSLEESELANSLASAATFSASDQIWLPNGSGGFAKYAYLTANPFAGLNARWVDSSEAVVDPATISFDDSSGVIVVRVGNNASMITIDSPDFYDSL